MNRVTITLTIDLPDGVVPNVEYSTPRPAIVVQEEPPFPDMPMALPTSASTPRCAQHGETMKRFPAGTNKAGKPYNASWRCSVSDCPTKPIWDRDAA
jgi:hypothetical protein